MFLHVLVLLSYLAIGSALLLAMTIVIICLRPVAISTPLIALGLPVSNSPQKGIRGGDRLNAMQLILDQRWRVLPPINARQTASRRCSYGRSLMPRYAEHAQLWPSQREMKVVGSIMLGGVTLIGVALLRHCENSSMQPRSQSSPAPACFIV